MFVKCIRLKWRQKTLIAFGCMVLFVSVYMLDVFGINFVLNEAPNVVKFDENEISYLNYYFHDKSIAILGLIHESESTLPALLNQLHIFSCSFLHVVYMFYESNSMDNTSIILKEWYINNLTCKIPSIITKIILDILPSDATHSNINLDRTERYAKYRNYLLQNLKIYSISHNIDYVMMIDMDIISFNPLITLNELNYAINVLKYSVMCNHGIFGYEGYYYDVFATILDDGSWTRFDYFAERQKLDKIIALNNFTTVSSCFNGIIFYKYSTIFNTNCSYIASEKELKLKYPQFIEKYLKPFRKIKQNNKSMICEHIAFNYCIQENDYKIGISRDAYVFYNKESLSYQPLI